MKPSSIILILFYLLLGMTTSTLAKSADRTSTPNNHAAHVHGVSILTLAIENNVLELQLESPASNLIGFERKAVTSAEITLVKNVEASLKHADQLFSFMGTTCMLNDSTIDLSAVFNPDDDKHSASNTHYEPHDHNKHNHHRHHSPSEVDDHKNSTHNKHHESHHQSNKPSHSSEQSHSEIIAIYQFNCENTQDLSSITVDLFAYFAGIEEIQTIWISEVRQGSATLSADNNRIRLRE